MAVSMMCGKEALVFDEPTSGLDYNCMTKVANLIRRLSKQGKIKAFYGQYFYSIHLSLIKLTQPPVLQRTHLIVGLLDTFATGADFALVSEVWLAH